MTYVIRAEPAAAPTTEIPADPPTIKNAGLEPEGSIVFLMALALLSVCALAVGSMLLAVMASHARKLHGLILHTLLGLASLLLMAVAIVADAGLEALTIGSGLEVTMTLGVLWLLLAILGLVVGSMVRPSPRSRPRA